MKKLLSICFLSILLGLLSFSASAQNGNPVPCGGFWIENLQPDMVSQVANFGASELPLSHTLGNAVRTGSGIYVGNAEMNREDLYELHICGCDIDDNKKVSIDWELFWLNPATGEYERVNDNLDQYAELSIYTQFRELNADGSFQRVSWLGGQVPNGMGFCEPVQDNPNDPMHSPQCDGITNYPGAMQAQVGLPGSVANALGEPVPAIGQTPIYTQGLDYFYMHFLKQTRTIVHIKWQQYGKFFLVMKIRERIGNTTDWTNLWYDNDETKYIGGHMSCCGEVLFTDTIGYPVFDTLRTHICEDADPLVLGSPESFSFDRTIPDTNVIIGNLVTIPGTNCAYLDVDSVRHVCFYVRHNPVVRYTNKVKEYCACDDFTVTPATFGLRFDPKDLDVAIDTAFYWQTKGRNATEQANPNNWVKDIMTAWGPNAKTIDDNKDTIYTYIVRQVNTYLYAGETIVCEGPIDTLYLKIKSVKAPALAMDKAEICREQVNENVTLKITSTPGECGSSTRWYTNINTSGGNSYEYMMNNPGNRFTSRIITSSEIVVNTTNKNELVVNLESFMPKTNKDTTIYFMATTVDPTIDGCESKFFNIVKFDIHKTPEITIVQPKAINCPGATVDMKVTITNNPDPRYTYYWEGDVDVASEDVEKTVGTGSGTTTYFPANNYYNHSYSQQIFTSEEIGATGTIKTIAFQNANTSTTNDKLRRNVTVSFALTDKVAFNSNASAADGREWITDGLTDVFEGVLDCNKANEWIELQLNTPFNYDGTKNLVVVVYDHSINNSSAVKFKTTPKQGAAMHAYEDNGNPMTRAKTSRYVRDYRNNMIFTFEAEVTPTPARTVTEQYTISDDAQCNDSYLATVRVKDGNGCYSEPDTFRFGVGVEHAPTVSGVPTTPFIVYACGINPDNIPTWEYDDLEDYHITVTDDCNKGMSLTKSDADVLHGVCNDTLVRTYTVHNLCDSTVSFTVTYISVDTTKPEFHIAEGVSPYVRLLPVRAENCKYDAPEKDVLVNAVLGRVSDNCAEMDFNYLMSHAEFYWQNSNIPVVGSKDIFGAALEQDLGYTIGNQLTVRVHVWDNCGNAADSVLIYFNRPDTLHVEYPSITNDLGRRPGICQDSSFTLTFNPDQVKFDHDFTPALPLHYEWQCEQTDVVIATPNEPQTRVTPQGVDKVYIFRMHVTDDLGCDAYSEPMQVRVKANPNIVIVPDIRNGAEFPLCPTYGVLTLEVVDATTLTQVPNLHYTWSGESVNNASTDDTSSVYIIPDRCTETYYPTVDVYDLEYHCPATAVLEVPVTDTVGPKYYGEPIHDTVPVLAGCIYKVPDFIHYLNNSNLIDNCYPFSTFTITQVPAEGTVIDKDTAVTIRVKTPCDNKTYEIKGKFFANLPLDRLMASAEAVPTSGCSGTEFTITGSYSNNHGDVSFAWKKNGTSINNNTNSITEQNYVADGQDSTDYTYSLIVTDELGCTAPASATVRVYKTVTDVQTATYPNTHCAAPWDGSLAVLHALKVNKYEIVFTPTDQTLPVIRDVRNSEVPGIDTQVEETTHIFDKLPEGTGILYVTTPKGCTTDFNFTISGNRPTIVAPVVTAVAPTTCKNIDGKLVFTIETGYSYEVRNENGEIVTNYNALTPGRYSVKKIDNATLCESELAYATVEESEATLPLYATTSPNTSCTEPNGKLYLNNANTVHCNVFFAGEEIAHNKQGVVTIENLAAGVYTTYAADSVSGCHNMRYDTIKNDIVYPSFTIKTEPNNYCQNEDNLVNGKITLTPATGYMYTVTSGDAVITDLTALAAGNYHIKAVSAEGCVTERDTFIVDDLYYPALGDTNFTANTICTENGPFDGAVEIVVTATGDNVVQATTETCIYHLVMDCKYGTFNGHSKITAKIGNTTNTYQLAQGQTHKEWNIDLTSGSATFTFNNPTNNSYWYDNAFTLTDQFGNVIWNLTYHTSYEYDARIPDGTKKEVTSTCGRDGITPDAARDQYIKNYSITFEGVTTENIDQNSVTYSGLDNGLYKFSFVSAYKCASPEYQVEVPQYEYPKLAMHATPNTMCVPTFEHPGNGTIVIDNTPTYTFCDINRYDYVFYYADPSNVEVPGDRLEVPYFNMDNYTMYHLTDTLYYVDLFDNLKGCHIHDTITVPHADDYVTGTAQATANKNCKAPYDGTVTVDATAYNADNTVNVDAVLRYSIVSADFSMPYQVSNVFTGVKNGSYIVLVKDTTTGCVYTLDEPVEVDQTPNDITINYTTTPNHACVSGFDGTLTATATSNIFTNADYVYKLQGEEEYTANHYWTGLHGQYTVYVMDNVSGCTAEDLIPIPDDNICIPDVTITPNNNNNYGEDYGFCANTENAQLIANATKDASCPAGDFKYTWTIQCHQIVSEGATLNINTNVTQDECCIYDLHVEDLGTGCTKDTSVRVCIFVRNYPSFVSRTHEINNNRIVACQNDNVNIGVANPTQWNKIIWSGGEQTYVTPAGETYDPDFTISARELQTNHIYTYCVDVEDNRGCWARGNISLTTKDTSSVVVYDTACSGDKQGEWTIWENTTYEPITFTQDVVVGQNVNGCDSVVHYYHTVLPDANADFTKLPKVIDTVFCTPSYILQAMYDSVKVKVGTLKLYRNVSKNPPAIWVLVDKDAPVFVASNYTDYKFVVENGDCDPLEHEFRVFYDSVPSVVTLTADDYYCAGEDGTVNAGVTVFGAGVHQVKAYMKDNEDVILGSDYTVFGYNDVSFTFPMYRKYNGKTLVVEAYGDCGSTKKEVILVVDTDYIVLNPGYDEYCEGDTLKLSQILGQQVGSSIRNIKAMIQRVQGTPVTPISAGVNYALSLQGFTNEQDLDGVTLNISSNVTAVAATTSQAQRVNSQYPRYFTQGSALRIYPGNTLTFTPANGMLIDSISLTIANSGAATISAKADGQSVTVTNGVVKNINASQSVVFTIGGTSGHKKISNIYVHYNNGASSTQYGVAQEYQPGTPLTYPDDNQAKLFFTATSDCNDEVVSSVKVITVNPQPRIKVDAQLQNPVCQDGAVAYFNEFDLNNIHVQFATDSGWMYKLSTAAQTADPIAAASTEALVNAIKDAPEAHIYYFASNDCGDSIYDFGTIRMLHKMDILDAEITICPNAEFSGYVNDLKSRITVSDAGNLNAGEWNLTFWGGSNYATQLTDNMIFSQYLNNSKIRAIATPTVGSCGGDTSLVTVNVLTNTFKPDTLQPACDGAPLRDFVKTQPQWTGTASLVDQYWEVYDYKYATDEYVRHKVTLDSIMLAERWPEAYYVFVTECGDTIKTSTVNAENVTLKFNFTPTVTINEQYDTLTKCLGDTIKLAELNYTAEFVDILVADGTGFNPHNHNADQVMGDTAWTINGTSYAADGKIVVTTDHNLSLLVLSVESECGNGYDTLVVKVAPIPEPSAKGDNTICLNDATILTVVDANPNSDYTWFLVNEDEESTAGDYEIASGTIAEITFSTDNLDDNHTTITGNVDGFTVERQDFYHFYVVETSEYNCTSVTMENESDIMLGESDVITIKSTDLPQFKFYTRDTVENKHFYTTTGEENQYLWEISGDCPNSDMRLFVEFYIYKDNELIAHVGDDFDVRTNGSGKPWMHSDTLSWFTSLNHYTSRVMFYNNSVPGNQNAQGVFDGNHFPNTNLVGLGSADYYDWLYYHYFNHRKIVSTLVPFTKTGEYTFVYKLWSTSLGMEINDLYTDEVTGQLRKIGGANCMAAGTTLKLIAEDSLFFHVTGENYGPVSTDPVVAPSLAPEVVVETVAPEMEVWPNPASAITTTLKARVHHMAGDATVTLTNLTGKSIYNGTMYIDNDNYYFEVGVNNLSVGSYVMTVRTNDAVITKKVVVAPLTK